MPRGPGLRASGDRGRKRPSDPASRARRAARTGHLLRSQASEPSVGQRRLGGFQSPGHLLPESLSPADKGSSSRRASPMKGTETEVPCPLAPGATTNPRSSYLVRWRGRESNSRPRAYEAFGHLTKGLTTYPPVSWSEPPSFADHSPGLCPLVPVSWSPRWCQGRSRFDPRRSRVSN